MMMRNTTKNMMSSAVWVAGAMLVSLTGTNAAVAQCLPFETAKLAAPDVFGQDQLGLSVAVDGDIAVAGAPNDEFGQGSVYIYEYDALTNGWKAKTKLLNPTGLMSTNFGQSVAVSGDIVVVGAPEPFPAERNGVVYVYQRPAEGWPMEPPLLDPIATLTASDGEANDNFGYSVAMDGDTIVVGCYLDEHVEVNNGSAYVFTKSGASWTTMNETARLTPSRTELELHFGVCVAIDGDTIVVGADRDSENVFSAGAAFVFEKPGAGWVDGTERAKLTASNPVDTDRLGLSVDVSGDTVVAGAWGDDTVASKAGAAYVFVSGGDWANMTETAKLTSSDGVSGDHLGWSVAIDNDVVAAGAPGNLFDGAGDGKTYLYLKPFSGWSSASETAVFANSDAPGTTGTSGFGDEFGIAMAMTGGRVVSGARYHDTEGYSQSGAAYVLHGMQDCNGNGTLDMCEIMLDPALDVDRNGVLDECEVAPPCDADFDDDGSVGTSDFFALLQHWGACQLFQPCPWDITGEFGTPDANVSTDDFFLLLQSWGPCP
jgi:hypothetical protein